MHGEIDSWQLAEPLDEYNKNAVLIVALYVDIQVAWGGRNDFLLARLTDLLFGKSLRAHPNGTSLYTNGAWTQIYELTASQQTAFDCSSNRARFLLYRMAPKSDDDVPVGGVHRTWVQVKEFLRTFDSWSQYWPIEDFELEAQH